MVAESGDQSKALFLPYRPIRGGDINLCFKAQTSNMRCAAFNDMRLTLQKKCGDDGNDLTEED